MKSSKVWTIPLLILVGWLLVTPVAAETLRLVAKHPGSWVEQPELGSAEITYQPDKGRFRLTATGLAANESYALVQHTQQGNGQGYIITGIKASSQGTATAQGEWSHWQGKIWLVLQRDVAGKAGDQVTDQLTGWHPRHYLFETRLL
ncbi:hypothetical protein [Desulfuromonas acetoxidans]|uniref:hypothetical protein n=1 Tax=Desulfuromonas acetoxidans TaxID=891 RepID=UPI00292E28BB|nr:hypothetical protein [Desulfuromonas acetoxidans]